MVLELFVVSVIEKARKRYTNFENGQTHIGYVWMEDKDHIWFKFIHQDEKGMSYISSPYRFIKDEVIRVELSKQFTLF